MRRFNLCLAVAVGASIVCAAPATARPRHHHRQHSVEHKRKHDVERERIVQYVRTSTIARVLATPCQNTEITPEPANLALAQAAVLCLINRQRAAAGELPLRIDVRLQRLAEGHSWEMVADDYFGHDSPDGATPVDRAKAAGYIPGPSFGYVIGENIAWGTLSLSTPQAIVDAWTASPEHLANILEGAYRDTGIGVVAEVPFALGAGVAGASYTQDFGVTIP